MGRAIAALIDHDLASVLGGSSARSGLGPVEQAKRLVEMPRTIDEIISQAEVLATRFEDYEPDANVIKDASALRDLRQAFLARAGAEQRVTDAVRRARAGGHSWASIGAMIGTSGEAARQRYAQKPPRS